MAAKVEGHLILSGGGDGVPALVAKPLMSGSDTGPALRIDFERLTFGDIERLELTIRYAGADEPTVLTLVGAQERPPQGE